MECADLIVDLSPPSSNQAVSPDLSPSEYIHHPSMLSLIRQKSSLDIGPKTHKRCYLEPAPIETDQTIAQYYNRVFESVFKANISVRIPGEGIVQMLCDGQVLLLVLCLRPEYRLTGLGLQESFSHHLHWTQLSERSSWEKNLRAWNWEHNTAHWEHHTAHWDQYTAQWEHYTAHWEHYTAR